MSFEELGGKSSLQSPSLELSYPLSGSLFKQFSTTDLVTEFIEEAAVSCGVSVLVAAVFLMLLLSVASCVSGALVPIS